MTQISSFAIATVLYRPSPLVLERMSWLNAVGYSVYVFDNSPDEALCSFFRSHGGFRYLTTGKNVGLGYALSAVFAQAYYEGHASVLFFDQDTGFEDVTLRFIEDCWRLTPELTDKFSAISFRASAPRSDSESVGSRRVCETRFIINSGTFFFLDRVKRIGWFDTRYFVDLVDYDFCLRSAIAGYTLGIVYNTPGFDHVTEQADVEYRAFNRSIRLRAYGIRRVWTSIQGYVRLLMLALARWQLGYFVALTRSASIYCCGQIMARVASLIWLPVNARSPSSS